MSSPRVHGTAANGEKEVTARVSRLCCRRAGGEVSREAREVDCGSLAPRAAAMARLTECRVDRMTALMTGKEEGPQMDDARSQSAMYSSTVMTGAS